MAIFSSKKTKTAHPRRRQGDGTTSAPRAFQRNRTLTGSASSAVKSANQSSADLKSPRVRAHHLALLRRRVGLGFLVVLLIAALLAGLVSQFSSRAVVTSSALGGGQQERYQGMIEQYLQDQPMERLRFMLDEQALLAHVRSSAPEVMTVSQIGSAGFGKTEFNLVMRNPVAGWVIGDSQQYVDATGTAFSRNYFEEPTVELVDDSGVDIPAGQTVISNRFLGFVGQLVGLAEANGYTVSGVVIPPATTRQAEAQLKGVDYPIKLSIDRQVGVQVEDMTRAINWLQDNDKSPQYVDVRASGRAYYR